ncbi:hypothetical protein FACS1894156_6630 [Bacteroidia bacterium]|nr:hypothetical protein AGMMS4956_03130 [Bacteroidia bacterium]GHU96060.1 hypothetical protein FACS1894156_6630 [Bacteroidia bacterium]
MNTKDEIDEMTDKILKGLKKSYKDLIAYKRKNHEKLIIFKNNKVVSVNP